LQARSRKYDQRELTPIANHLKRDVNDRRISLRTIGRRAEIEQKEKEGKKEKKKKRERKKKEKGKSEKINGCSSG